MVLTQDVIDAIFDSEEAKVAFFDTSPIMNCIVGEDGCFKYVNSSWTKYLGWSADELTSKSFFEFIHPEDINSSKEEYASENDGDVKWFKNRYKTISGNYVTLFWLVTNIKVGDYYLATAIPDVLWQKIT